MTVFINYPIFYLQGPKCHRSAADWPGHRGRGGSPERSAGHSLLYIGYLSVTGLSQWKIPNTLQWQYAAISRELKWSFLCVLKSFDLEFIEIDCLV